MTRGPVKMRKNKCGGRLMNLNEELDAKIQVAQLKEWINECPERCPLAKFFESLIAAMDDREVLKYHLKICEDE